MHLTNRFILVACMLGSALAVTKKYELALTNEYIQPDGYNRSAIIVNKKLPGTLITANKGDRLQVNIVNKLTDPSMPRGTSIHWHGLLQHRTADQDGTAWVTQCPIAPGSEFQYDFPLGDQTGTYWYHSHVTTQYCDGLRGALVIYDNNDPHKSLYDVDNENTVITLGDWFHSPSPRGWRDFDLQNSTVINGLGRMPGKKTNALSIVNVDYGKRYRFRIVNTACVASFNFSIDAHKLTVIEADGVETRPLTVDVVPIYAGQRYSVVLNATQKIDNYWIRSRPEFIIPKGNPFKPINETGVDAAILRYTGARQVEPTTSKTGFEALKEQNLVPLQASTLNGQTPDQNITLTIGSRNHDFASTVEIVTKDGTNTYPNVTFAPPPVPVLLQILRGKVDPRVVMPKGSVLSLPRDKLINITIPGGLVNAPHPFHLHGHTFEVVRSAGTNVTNRVNPPVRDVVNTGLIGDDVSILFRTDNPGPWIFHCHIDYHLEAGLAIVFAEDVEGQTNGTSSIQPESDLEKVCDDWAYTPASAKYYSVTDKLPEDE